MADIKISQLGSAIAVDDSDIVPVVSGGNTLKATAAQLKEHAIGNTSISGIGNGSVTGAISALNSEKQPKTLAIPITVDDTPQTTVEGALGAINTDLGSTKQALTNLYADLTSISIIGSTNNTGSTIAKGTFFYLNGTLARAKTSIANGATLTSNTNYETVTAGSLNEINDVLSNVKLQTKYSTNIASNETAYISSASLGSGTYLVIAYTGGYYESSVYILYRGGWGSYFKEIAYGDTHPITITKTQDTSADGSLGTLGFKNTTTRDVDLIIMNLL